MALETDEELELRGDVEALETQITHGKSLLKHGQGAIEAAGDKEGRYKGVFTRDEVEAVIKKLTKELAKAKRALATAKKAKKGGRRTRRRHGTRKSRRRV